MEIFATYKIPVGEASEAIAEWLRQYAGWVFDFIGAALAWCLDATLDLLLYMPFAVPVLLLFAGAVVWFLRGRWLAVVLAVFGFLVIFNQGYWRETMETLSPVFWSCALSMAIGVPTGVLAACSRGFYRFLRPVLAVMQVVPVLVCLIPAVFFLRAGMVAVVVATLVLVLPIPIRLTRAGIAATPETLLEAVQALGANRWQMLWKVELRHAWPYIRSGMAQMVVLSLAATVMLAALGGNGLGGRIWDALQANNAASGFEAGFVIAVVAVVLDQLFRPGKEARHGIGQD